MKRHYEQDAASFPADAYRVAGHAGIAWRALGWETSPDEDTEWSGYEPRTGRVVIVMVGDDSHFTCDEGDLMPLDREDYCGSCGQLGCGGGGL